jgi:type IV secretory pathway TrbL component
MSPGRLGATATLASVLLLAAGCSSGSSSGSPEGTGSVSNSSSAFLSDSPSPTSPSALSTSTGSHKVILKDGRYPTYILKVRPGTRRVTLDLVQFFTGPAASKAAKEDHAAEVPPPNDYWIRNANMLLRTLPVRSGARVTVNTLAAEETGSADKDLKVTLTKLSSYNLSNHLFWVTVRGDTVTALTEQFLP